LFSGMSADDSITDKFCSAQKTAFGDTNSFAQRGGMAGMGNAFKAGMVRSPAILCFPFIPLILFQKVLVLSLWDDHFANMLWLDSAYPLNKDASTPGVKRGECSTDSGKPTDVEANYPNAQVTYSNIKYGPIGSTYAS
jgi:cellulose 1,4-beta-cellobiosidase